MYSKAIGAAALVALVSTTTLADDTTNASSTSSLVQLKCQAGQIPKFDGADWVCAGDEVGAANGPAFVLKASDDTVIGSVISVSRVQGIIRVTTVVNFETQDGTKSVALEATSRTDFIADPNQDGSFRDSSVLFTEAGCGGTPYLSSPSGFPGALWPVAVSVATDGSGLRQLFIATSQSLETRQFLSESGVERGRSAGVCFDYSPPIDAVSVPAELVEGNLDAVFPPPFTLEFAN